MIHHIEEARKLEPCGWLVKPKGSAKVGTFFDHEPHFGNCENWDREDYEVNPIYDAAALTAAEERGRIEERERIRLGLIVGLRNWMHARYGKWITFRSAMHFADEITKEPTP